MINQVLPHYSKELGKFGPMYHQATVEMLKEARTLLGESAMRTSDPNRHWITNIQAEINVVILDINETYMLRDDAVDGGGA
jgi:hypothetical protein